MYTVFRGVYVCEYVGGGWGWGGVVSTDTYESVTGVHGWIPLDPKWLKAEGFQSNVYIPGSPVCSFLCAHLKHAFLSCSQVWLA